MAVQRVLPPPCPRLRKDLSPAKREEAQKREECQAHHSHSQKLWRRRRKKEEKRREEKLERERKREEESRTKRKAEQVQVMTKKSAEEKSGQVWGSIHAAYQVQTRGMPQVTAGKGGWMMNTPHD